MGMELTHTFTVPASVEQTWSLLIDLEQVGGCFPGATVTETDGDTFSGTVKVKLGPIQMQYAGTGSFLERDDVAHRAVIEGKGKDKRGNGTASATATMSLTPDGDGTAVEVLTDLVVTGKPAQFGRGVMQDVSDKLLSRFVDCLESTLGSDEGEAGSDAESAATQATAQAPEIGQPVLADPTPAAGTDDVGAAAPAGPAAPVAPVASVAPAPPAAPAPNAARVSPRPSRPAPDDDAIDLGDLVGPVLRERYGLAFGAGVAGLILGILIGRAIRRG